MAQQLATATPGKFRKTRLCTYFLEGDCLRGTSCTFAHSRAELSSTPDLSRTKMCFQFFRNNCNDASCKFAHGYQELRATGDVYKTQECHGFRNGFCRFGDICRYAHGDMEIRTDTLHPAAPAPEALPLPSGVLTSFVSEETAVAQFYATWSDKVRPPSNIQVTGAKFEKEEDEAAPVIGTVMEEPLYVQSTLCADAYLPKTVLLQDALQDQDPLYVQTTPPSKPNNGECKQNSRPRDKGNNDGLSAQVGASTMDSLLDLQGASTVDTLLDLQQSCIADTIDTQSGSAVGEDDVSLSSWEPSQAQEPKVHPEFQRSCPYPQGMGPRCGVAEGRKKLAEVSAVVDVVYQ